MIKVESSCMSAYEENMKEKTLDVQFPSGAIYRYFDVPHSAVEQMAETSRKGESVGKFFCRNIRNSYQYERLN